MRLSILTATYNRGEYLKELYKSIIRNLNTVLDVEWIIIDDGSTDNTKEIVDDFIKMAKFEIKYYYQKNSGKMVAINKAVEMSSGELIVDCDSDDYFTSNAFSIITKNANLLLESNDLYALCFLKKSSRTGKISGDFFKKNYLISTMFDLYFKDDIKGEKILVFNARIRKKFKHELEEGENFVTEARMYHKMDEHYKILCINEVLQIGDYLKDGYTKNIEKSLKANPKGYHMYFEEILKKGLKGVKLRKRLYIIKNFIKM